jgi:hypothetical protein
MIRVKARRDEGPAKGQKLSARHGEHAKLCCGARGGALHAATSDGGRAGASVATPQLEHAIYLYRCNLELRLEDDLAHE